MKLSLSHYHVSCPDKMALARWYQTKLGFQIVANVEDLGEKDGPVFISADGGNSGIAIFTAKASAQVGTKCIPAFEASPESFLQFYENQRHETSNLVVYDHLISFSIYIVDPVGTKIEILCSQYKTMAPLLEKAGITAKRMNPSHDPSYQKM